MILIYKLDVSPHDNTLVSFCLQYKVNESFTSTLYDVDIEVPTNYILLNLVASVARCEISGYEINTYGQWGNELRDCLESKDL